MNKFKEGEKVRVITGTLRGSEFEITETNDRHCAGYINEKRVLFDYTSLILADRPEQNQTDKR